MFALHLKEMWIKSKFCNSSVELFKAFARATNTMVFFMVNAHMTACMRHLVTEVADLLQSDMGRLQLPNVRLDHVPSANTRVVTWCAMSSTFD